MADAVSVFPLSMRCLRIVLCVWLPETTVVRLLHPEAAIVLDGLPHQHVSGLRRQTSKEAIMRRREFLVRSIAVATCMVLLPAQAFRQSQPRQTLGCSTW